VQVKSGDHLYALRDASGLEAVQVESAEIGEVDLAESVTVHLDRELTGRPQLRVEQSGNSLRRTNHC
jgi:hypothetical protein